MKRTIAWKIIISCLTHAYASDVPWYLEYNGCKVCEDCALPSPHGLPRLAYPSSSWLMVTCLQVTVSPLDLSTCPATTPKDILTWDDVEHFWTKEFSSAECVTAFSKGQLTTLRIDCFDLRSHDIVLSSILRVSEDGTLACPNDTIPKNTGRDLPEMPPDNDVVRVILPNTTALRHSVSSNSNSTMTPTTDISSGLDCAAVPTRAFRPSGWNSSVCNSGLVDSEHMGAGASVRGNMLRGLSVGLVIVLIGLT